ncbi:MAG TPA: cytochrome c biogenesis CcdA family protein [Stellaceae bacterium]|nr:cytochrome c biogenesis CcdA family protein [Stellaceae bacterium]
MNTLSIITLLTSFGAGVVSFLSPCVLPLVPGYVSYVAGDALTVAGGQPSAGTRLAALRLSLLFVLGFSTVFVLLGASATTLGELLLSYRYEANLVGGAVVVLLGLFMMGLANPSWLQREFRFHPDLRGGRPAAAYVIGVAFAFGWTPCIGPVLGAILTTSAVSATVRQGIVLLAFYSLGLGLPFLAAAVFTDRLMSRLKSFGRLGRGLQFGAGALVSLMGVAMLTGELTSFSYWLLDTFPILSRIG